MPQEKDDIFKDAEKGKKDELHLEIRKEERKIKPPIKMYKIILILLAILIISSGIAVGIAKLIAMKTSDPNREFFDWISIIFMIFGGITIFFGGIAGFWGGQRKIPIRLISPSDSSVVGKGLIVTGYVIEECKGNEIELRIYGKDKELLYEEFLPLTEEGLFYSKLDTAFESLVKSSHITFEVLMTSLKSKKLKFAVIEKNFEELNIAKQGLKIGKIYFYSLIYKDFKDGTKVIFDPKRKEKGYIENVVINEQSVTNIFFPTKGTDDNYVPFSFERIAAMRLNAYYFDFKRRRRLLLSFLLILMTLCYFIIPLIGFSL